VLPQVPTYISKDIANESKQPSNGYVRQSHDFSMIFQAHSTHEKPEKCLVSAKKQRDIQIFFEEKNKSGVNSILADVMRKKKSEVAGPRSNWYTLEFDGGFRVKV
jgi:hypothetical protein